MRVLHLGFQLDCPFGDAAQFRERNQRIYQPFFAFLERNVQKYPEFRISLQVSGAWIEQAAQFDNELIRRLDKLARAGKVEFLATPYYNSLAFFYDTAEFEAEMWLYKEKIQDLFGAVCRVCAFPDLMFNDRLALAAEKQGYLGVLAGGLPKNIVRRFEERVYDVVGCRQVRVLWRNTELSEYLMSDFGQKMKRGMRKEAALEKALAEFRKKLELAAMRGGVVNIFLDAETFARQREAGVIKFLDEFLAGWLKKPESPLATATDLALARGVEDEISVRKTVSWRDGYYQIQQVEPGLVRLSDIEYRPMEWLDGCRQREVLKEIYDLKPEVFRTEDEGLIAEFCALTALDRVYVMSDDAFLRGVALGGALMKQPSEAADDLLEKLGAIKTRVAEIWREKQAEIERREVVVVQKKKTETVAQQTDAPKQTDESTEVLVNFGVKKEVVAETADIEDNIKSVLVEQVVEEEAEDDFQVDVKIAEKERPIQRILKKIVIE